jgi:Peptidase C13 family/YcxB-like protein
MLQERLMEEILKVDADLTSVDYETFFAVATRKIFGGKAVRVRSGLILIVSIVLLVSLILIVPSFFPASPFIQLALLFILYASSVHFWNRYSRQLMAPEQNGPLLGPHSFFLTPEGFEDHGNLTFSRTTWSAVQAIQETPQHLYVFIDKTTAHIIPRRSFATPEDYAEFVQTLRGYVQRESGAPFVEIPSSAGGRSLMAFSALILIVIFVSTTLLLKAPSHSTVQHQKEVRDSGAEEAWEEGEALLYAQSALVEKQMKALLPERPGIVDVYFVGFGSSDEQDVFMKEVLYAQQLFDRRFDTRGRSTVLINNSKTRREVPLASGTNLRATLQHMGRVMNPEEDILFLLLSSHGSKDHKLSVDYWSLPLKRLSSAEIATMIEKAGIKWRVVIVSACYSGGFINKLRDNHALIITSSPATQPSYGCGKDDDLTYFGKAFLADQLNQGADILGAFTGATTLLQQRAIAEKLKVATPQLSSPPAMTAKLKTLEARLVSHRQH